MEHTQGDRHPVYSHAEQDLSDGILSQDIFIPALTVLNFFSRFLWIRSGLTTVVDFDFNDTFSYFYKDL